MTRLAANIFFVGAPKTGSTYLSRVFEKSSDVFVPAVKEPHYFASDFDTSTFSSDYRRVTQESWISGKIGLSKKRHIDFIKDEDKYLGLYKKSERFKYRLDSSTGYLFSDMAALEIAKFDANAKIIICLRHPVERAFSHWVMDRRIGLDNSRSFIEAIERDLEIEPRCWGLAHLYIDLGLYYKQVKKYLNLFKREQILILDYADLVNSPIKFLDQVRHFLELDTIEKELIKVNQASLPRFPKLISVLKSSGIDSLVPPMCRNRLRTFLYSVQLAPSVSSEERRYVGKYFQSDILKLEELLNADFGHWNV